MNLPYPFGQEDDLAKPRPGPGGIPQVAAAPQAALPAAAAPVAASSGLSPQESGSVDLVGDYGRILGMGAAGLGQGVAHLANVATDNAVERQIGAEGYMARKSAELEAGLTPRMKEARGKEFLTDDWTPGEAWSDPHSYGATVVESLPLSAASMLPALRSAKAAKAGAMARGATAAESTVAAERAAAAAGGISEGAITGGMDASQVQRQIMDPRATPEETLAKSPEYQAMLAGGMLPEVARAKIAEQASNEVMLTTGVSTGIQSAWFGKYLGRLVGEGSPGGRMVAGFKGAANEGLSEIGQSGSEQALQNLAMQRHVNPDQAIMEGVPNAMAQGGIAGGITGGGVSAVVGAPQDESQSVTQSPATPEQGAIDAGAHTGATSPLNDVPQPSDDQKRAGNYKKGHVRVQGLDISIENAAGSDRSGVDEDGKAWATIMSNHYGYIKGTTGKDKDHVDAYIGPKAADPAAPVYVIDQVRMKGGQPTSDFDEHKVMIGFGSPEEAARAYGNNYSWGPASIGNMTPMTMAEFKKWSKNPKNTSKPAADQFWAPDTTGGSVTPRTIPGASLQQAQEGAPEKPTYRNVPAPPQPPEWSPEQPVYRDIQAPPQPPEWSPPPVEEPTYRDVPPPAQPRPLGAAELGMNPDAGLSVAGQGEPVGALDVAMGGLSPPAATPGSSPAPETSPPVVPPQQSGFDLRTMEGDLDLDGETVSVTDRGATVRAAGGKVVGYVDWAKFTDTGPGSPEEFIRQQARNSVESQKGRAYLAHRQQSAVGTKEGKTLDKNMFGKPEIALPEWADERVTKALESAGWKRDEGYQGSAIETEPGTRWHYDGSMEDAAKTIAPIAAPGTRLQDEGKLAKEIAKAAKSVSKPTPAASDTGRLPPTPNEPDGRPANWRKSIASVRAVARKLYIPSKHADGKPQTKAELIAAIEDEDKFLAAPRGDLGYVVTTAIQDTIKESASRDLQLDDDVIHSVVANRARRFSIKEQDERAKELGFKNQRAWVQSIIDKERGNTDRSAEGYPQAGQLKFIQVGGKRAALKDFRVNDENIETALFSGDGGSAVVTRDLDAQELVGRYEFKRPGHEGMARERFDKMLAGGGAPSAPPAPPATEQKATEPKTIEQFEADLRNGRRAHYDFDGMYGITMWVEDSGKGWVLKTQEDGSKFISSKGGVGPTAAARWNVDDAVASALQEAEYRFTEWKSKDAKDAKDAKKLTQEEVNELRSLYNTGTFDALERELANNRTTFGPIKVRIDMGGQGRRYQAFIETPNYNTMVGDSTGMADSETLREFIHSRLAPKLVDVLSEALKDYPKTSPRTGRAETTPPKTGADVTQAHMDHAYKAARQFRAGILSGQGLLTSVAKALGFEVYEKDTHNGKVTEEVSEAALVQVYADIAQDEKLSDDEKQSALINLYKKQPKFTTRTGTSSANQAYSTPAPLAFAALRMAGAINNPGVVMDTSAGTAALLITSDPKTAVVNELNPERSNLLKLAGFGTTTEHDALEWKTDKEVDVVAVNPPFGREPGNATLPNGNTFGTNRLEFGIAMRAMEAMKAGGAGVIIVGGPNPKSLTDDAARIKHYTVGDTFEFNRELRRWFNVIEHFTVSGKLYQSQGAAWPVDVYIVGGRGDGSEVAKTDLPSVTLPKIIDNWEQINALVSATRERVSSARAKAAADAARVPNDAGQHDGQGGRSPAGGRAGAGGATSQPPTGGKGGPRDGGGVTPGTGGDGGRGRPNDGLGTNDGGLPGGKGPGPGPAANPSGPGATPVGEEIANVTDDELDSMIDDAIGDATAPELAPQDAAPAPATTKTPLAPRTRGPRPSATRGPKTAQATAGGKAVEAITETGSAISSALDAIFALTGGPGTLKSGMFAFDEKSYAAVQGHLKASLEHIVAAGKALKDFVKLVFADAKRFPAEWIENVLKPAVKRFVGEVRENKVIIKGLNDKPKITRADKTTPAPAGQAHYPSASMGTELGTYVPEPHAAAIATALKRLSRRVGDIDEFVVKKVGFADKSELFRALAAEQIDALALAIDNLDHNSGFIIGDQTGVGKGRFVASMIRYARSQGLIPVFVTEKPNLYVDMMRDLSDVGVSDLKPLLTNSGIRGTKALTLEDGTKLERPPGNHANTIERATNNWEGTGFDSIFTTYSQMNTVKGGERTSRHGLFEAVAPQAMFILDESHNAGGTGVTEEEIAKQQKRGKQILPREIFIRRLLASARGAVFSSATWAKRPQTMTLYAPSTDLSILEQSGRSLEEIFARGGVPLQQSVSSLLVESGQMMRREKSFEGINFDTSAVYDVDRDVVDGVASTLAGLRAFDENYAQDAIDAVAQSNGSFSGQNATQKINSVGFGSVMHNLLDQCFASLKAEQLSDHAIETLEDGAKLVIGMSNTNETAIAEEAERQGLTVGSKIDFTLKDLMRRFLRNTLRYKVTSRSNPNDPGYHVWIDPEELEEDGKAAYYAVLDQIDSIDVGSAPGSPIDYIKYRVTQAGFNIGEITGRSMGVNYAEGGTLYKRDAKEIDIQGRRNAINNFNGGMKNAPVKATEKIDVLVVNQAGATGASLHSSENFADQAPRTMLLGQYEKNIDTFMQLLGRINRTGQVNLPSYLFPKSNIPAETRLHSVMAKKLVSLNASVTGKGKTAVTIDTPDFLNPLGAAAAVEVLNDNPEMQAIMGLPGADNPEAFIIKLTGRVGLLGMDLQEQFYSELFAVYDRLVTQAEEMGQNVGAMTVLPLDAKAINRQIVNKATGDRPMEKAVYAYEIDAKLLSRPASIQGIQTEIQESIGSDRALGRGLDRDGLSRVVDQFDAGRDAFDRFQDAQDTKRMRELATRINIEKRKAEQKGEGWSEETEARLTNEAEKAISKRRDREEKDATALMSVLRTVMHPGAPVEVTINHDKRVVSGIVAATSKTGAAKNPHDLSQWSATIYLSTSEPRSIRLRLSDMTITLNGTKLSGGDKENSISVTDADYGRVEDDFSKAVEAAKSGRQKRVIMVGNAPAAFARFDGRITQFTDSSGKVGDGVLLPSNVTSLAEVNRRAMQLRKAEHIIPYLKGVLDGGGRALVNFEKLAFISMPTRDMLNFVVLSSRGAGKFRGKAAVDILKAAGLDFVRKRSVSGKNVWVAEVQLDAPGGAEAASALTNYMSGASRDPIFPEDLNVAAKVLGIKDMPPAERVPEGVSMIDHYLGAEETADGGARFSIGAKPAASGGMDVASLQAKVDLVVSGWSGLKGIPVRVIKDESLLPKAQRDELKKVRKENPDAVAQAVFIPRESGEEEILLVASNLGSVREAMTKLVHEAVGHLGAQRVFGERFGEFLDVLSSERYSSVAKFAEAYGLDMETKADRRVAAEEFLAHLAEDPKNSATQDILSRAMQVVRRALRAIGIKLAMTDNDIRGILAAARKYIETGGPAPGRGSITSLGNGRFAFAGQKSKTADTRALVSAIWRLKNGETADEVRRKTGWFEGEDGSWRYEIDDSDAKQGGMSWGSIEGMKAGESTFATLGQVLDHPALYAAYPAIADYTVTMVPGLKGASLTAARGQTPHIKVGYTVVPGAVGEVNLSSLLHEVQHGIQDIEGFASGGTQALFMPGNGYVDLQNLAAKEFGRGRAKKFTDASDRFLNAGLHGPALDYLGRASEMARFQAYQRLAGEVEARNVQRRMDMDAGSREQFGPEQTAEFTGSDVIVFYNGRVMQSAPAPANAYSEDLIAQLNWMQGIAAERGFADVDEFAQRDYEGFKESSREWRLSHPDLPGEARFAIGKAPRLRRGVERIMDDAETSKSWRDWYDRHVGVLQEVFDEDAPLFRDLLAITSQGATVSANVALALKAYRQLLLGLPFEGVGLGKANLEKYRSGVPVNGLKIGAFAAAMSGDHDSVVIDRHMARYLFGTDKPTKAMHEKGATTIKKVAGKLGWTPRETQAAIWAFQQHTTGIKEAADYEREIQARIEKIRATRAELASDAGGPGGEGPGNGTMPGSIAGSKKGPGASRFALGQAANTNPVLSSALRKAGLGVDDRSMLQRIKDYLTALWEDLSGGLKDRVIEGAFDRFHGIKVAEQTTLGALPAAEQSGYVSARMSTGSSSAMYGLMMHGSPEWRDGILSKKDGTKGLLEILQPVKDDLHDFLAWMVGRRAKRLMQEGRENNLDATEIAALIGLAQGKESMFEAVAADLDVMKRDVLDMAEDAGLIDATTRPTWEHADYIPFYRAQESGRAKGPFSKKGLSHQTSGIRRLRGGASEINDPLENLMRNFGHLIDASMKNHAIRQITRNLDGSEFLSKIPSVEFEQKLVPAEQIKQRLLDYGMDPMDVDNLPQDAMEGFAKMWAIKAPDRPDVVRVMDGGKAGYYQVHDAALLRGLTAVNQEALPLKVARDFKRLLTAGVTSDPAFWARNAIRDALHAWTINEDGFRLGTDTIKGAIKAFREDGGLVDMLFAGASFQGGYMNANDPEAMADSIRQALAAKGFSKAKTDSYMSTVVMTTEDLWRRYRRIGDAVENASREAVFEAAGRAQKSRAEQVFEAKDLMDYSMHGNWLAIRVFGDVLPFFNARLQGLYKLGRSGAVPGINTKKRAILRGGMIAAASILLYSINKDRDEYDELEEWDKDSNWHFFFDMPGSDSPTHIRMPKPFEIGLMYGTLPERWARLATGQDDTGKTAERMLWALGSTLEFNPVPQIARPATEVWANKNTFTGRSIENTADEGKLPSARYNERTSPVMRAVGEATSNLTGVSPKQMEHLWRGYLGSLGAYALSAADVIYRAGQGKEPMPESRVQAIPVIGSFVRDATPSHTRFTTEFYDMYREVEAIYRTGRAYLVQGQPEKADAIMKAEGNKLATRSILTGANKSLSLLRKESDMVMRDQSLTREERTRRIDAINEARNKIAKEAVGLADGAF